MSSVQVKLKMVPGCEDLIPTYATDGSAAFDCKARILNDEDKLVIPQGKVGKIGLGIHTAIPLGYVVKLYARSGLGSRGLTPNNCVGVVDSDYRGEWIAYIRNKTDEDYTINRGDRVIQGMLQEFTTAEFVLVDELDVTARNEGGFGSTGVQ